MAGKGKKNEYSQQEMNANFSALLYLLTEQQSLIGRLMQTLLESGLINIHQLQKITDMEAGEDGLTPIHTVLYNRFAK